MTKQVLHNTVSQLIHNGNDRVPELEDILLIFYSKYDQSNTLLSTFIKHNR